MNRFLNFLVCGMWLAGAGLLAYGITVGNHNFDQIHKIKVAAYEQGRDDGRSYGVCWVWAVAVESQKYPAQAKHDSDTCIDESIEAAAEYEKAR